MLLTEKQAYAVALLMRTDGTGPVTVVVNQISVVYNSRATDGKILVRQMYTSSSMEQYDTPAAFEDAYGVHISESAPPQTDVPSLDAVRAAFNAPVDEYELDKLVSELTTSCLVAARQGQTSYRWYPSSDLAPKLESAVIAHMSQGGYVFGTSGTGYLISGWDK